VAEEILLLALKVSVGRPEGKKPFGRPRREWELTLKKLGWGGSGMERDQSRAFTEHGGVNLWVP
jgi:hypothetical protein